MQIADRTFLVTGGGSGLGAACVRRLAAKSGRVVIADVRKEVGAAYMPAAQSGSPMTYAVNGKQYIAFTSGTPTEPAEVVALALEKR